MTQTSPPRNFIRHLVGQVSSSPIKGALLLSLLNQMVNSGGNFAVGVYLARTLTLANFGIYGICYGICMLYIGVGNAVILTQMVVNMADKKSADKEIYATRMLVATAMLGFATLALVAICVAVIHFVIPGLSEYSNTVMVVACTAVLLLAKEFFIRYAYLRREEHLAVRVSFTSVFILIGGLAVDHIVGGTLTPNKVLMLYASGAAAGAVIGYLSSPIRLFRKIPNLMPDLIEAWRHGRWALGGIAVTWMQSQTYTYVLALFIGPTAVGQANAARIFISPFSFLLPAINQIAIPRLSDLRKTAPRQMYRVAALITGALLLLVAVYSTALLSCLDSVSRLVLGRNDAGVQSLVWVWCFVVFNQMILNGGSAQLQVLRRFRTLTLLSAISAVVAISSAIVLTHVQGIAGAIWAVAIGETLLSIMIWREIRHARANIH